MYTKSNRAHPTLIGNLSPHSLQAPRHSIPFWGYFSNEPSAHEEENAYLDVNLKENYKSRDYVKKGDTMIYKLRALSTIAKNKEIMWCYGDSYHRSYQSACE